MAKQTINIGASPNDGTGTPLRTSFDYTNQNFTELYTAVGPSGNNIVVPGNATITGDLTVDTSTLKVDSTNNRVGIGTASPTATLHVSSSSSVHINQRTGSNGCFTQYIDPTSSNYIGTDSGNFRVANNSAQDLLNIQQLGVFTFGDGAGGTRMILNSTGLNIANGNVILGTSGKGIDFTAAGNVAGMTSELLNDYEEGTFSPTVTASSGTLATTTVNEAVYTKIGRLVSIAVDISVVNIGTASGQLFFSLPFNQTVQSNVGVLRELGSTAQMGQIIYQAATQVSAHLYNNGSLVVNGYRIRGTYTYTV